MPLSCTNCTAFTPFEIKVNLTEQVSGWSKVLVVQHVVFTHFGDKDIQNWSTLLDKNETMLLIGLHYSGDFFPVNREEEHPAQKGEHSNGRASLFKHF